ncbi:hypothetical protein CU024_0124 [Enterococcus faecium]|nr:hypothetical protein [Enterococcus faecium]MBK4786584.1 hypothetical protein [Enterococcus faecium]MBK4808213.1 hypothetical protein [Enterococcus faecium]MBK4845318.1 hypothetical protein [Enterococcus faecium]MBK4850933.1 hypothetical protein [Enterococcus faecium]
MKEKEYNRKMFERKGRGKMKKRASLLVLVALLFNIFSYGVAGFESISWTHFSRDG